MSTTIPSRTTSSQGAPVPPVVRTDAPARGHLRLVPPAHGQRSPAEGDSVGRRVFAHQTGDDRPARRPAIGPRFGSDDGTVRRRLSARKPQQDLHVPGVGVLSPRRSLAVGEDDELTRVQPARANGSGSVPPGASPAADSTTSLSTGAWAPVSPSSLNTRGIAVSGISSSMSRQPRSVSAASSLAPEAALIVVRSDSASRRSDWGSGSVSAEGATFTPSRDRAAGGR